jgi:carbon-monoxide dehydrogenase medium subunit
MPLYHKQTMVDQTKGRGMDYFRPRSLTEARDLLADEEDGRCLAGGQTLVAMMNTGILAPPRLVALRDIPGVDQIESLPDGGLRLGAMVTHATLAEVEGTGAHRLLPETARQIASPAIRAFGTVGGSLCHADPAADWPVALVALDASVEIFGSAGARTERLEEFIVDALTTSLEPGEILTQIQIPPAQVGSSAAFVKLARVEGDFATVSVAVTLSRSGGVCDDIRIVIGGCAPVPVRDQEAENQLRGTRLSDPEVEAAGKMLANAIQPEDDGRASAVYRRMVTPGLVRRAVHHALASA